jgi:hypothetical protein
MTANRLKTLENKGFTGVDSPEIGYLLIPSCESQASVARTAWVDGLKLPVGTPSGRVPQVVAPQCEQVRRCNRNGSTIGSILGRSAT